MTRWAASQIGDLQGRTVVVTGASSGLGAVISGDLARAGARVVMACRDEAKGARVASGLGPNVEVRHLDLADLRSVRAFASDTGELAVLISRGKVSVMAAAKKRRNSGSNSRWCCCVTT